jgi:hypothetical protein
VNRRHQDLFENSPHFDLSQNILLERSHYEGLLARLELLEHKPEKKRRGFWGWFLQRPVAILMALMMVGILGAGAWGQSQMHGFFSGNEYLAQPDTLRLGYIAGASDAFSSASPEYKKHLKLGMTARQVQAIAEKFLKDNPKDRHYVMATILHDAMIGTYGP